MKKFYVYEINTEGTFHLGADETVEGLLRRLCINLNGLPSPIHSTYVGTVQAQSVDEALNLVRSGRVEDL